MNIQSIDNLIAVSNKFQQSLDAIENLQVTQVDLGNFMIGNEANRLLDFDDMLTILDNHEQLIPKLMVMKTIYISWKSLIDIEIERLKVIEFPSEIQG